MRKVNLNDLSGQLITTANNRDIFNKYLNELNKYKPLSREEEVELFKSIREKNNQDALDKICKHNLRFVVSVAKRYSTILSKSALTLEDLVNEGNIGLCIAANRFDYTSGNKFISYAVWWIRQQILTSIQHNVKSIRIPQHIKKDINMLLDKQQELEQSQGCSVPMNEAFDLLMAEGKLNERYTFEKASGLLDVNNFEGSLNIFIGEGENHELIDLVKSDYIDPETELLSKERDALLNKMLDTLPTFIRNYFVDYYGLFGNERLNMNEMSKKYDELPQTIRVRMAKYLSYLSRNNKKFKTLFFEDKSEDNNTIYCI
jgi:RNA polymerase primary sigma factor